MRVYLSTVIRGAPVEEGGELIAVDWDQKRVLHRAPVFPSHPTVRDPNSRGSARGGRGIVVLPGEVFVATYHSLHGFTPELKPTRTLSYRHFAGLHELKLVEDGIWVSATAVGAVFKMGFDGQVRQEWWAHEDPVIEQRFSPPPCRVDKTADNRLEFLEGLSKVHLNHVDVCAGRVYVTLNNHGAIVRLFPTEVVACDPALKGCHNGLVTEDGEVLVNDSHHHTLIVFDATHGHVRRVIDLSEFPAVAKLMRASKRYKNIAWSVRVKNFVRRKRVARPLFVRGMCRLDHERLLIGVSPASVLEVDYRQGKLLDLMQLSDAVNECVHGLEAVPSLDFPYS